MRKFLLLIGVFVISFYSKIEMRAQENENSSNSNIYSSFFEDITYPENIEDFDYSQFLGTEIDVFMNWVRGQFDFNNPNDLVSNYIYIRYGASGSGSDTWVNYSLYLIGRCV